MNDYPDNLTPKGQPKRRIPLSFFIFPVLHLLIAIPLAYHLNIWSDEASSLYSTQDGFFSSIGNSLNEKQAPLYFVLLSAWRLLDDSIFFARLFSVICSVFSIGAFFLVARRFWREKTAFLATFFFSVHPYLIWASTEIRVYALVILLSLLIVLLFERQFLRDEPQGGWQNFAFVPLSVVALYTNFYLGFLLAGLFVVLITLKRKRAASGYLIQMAVTGAFFVPLIWFVSTGVSKGLDGEAFDYGVTEGFRRIWQHLLYFGMPTEMLPPEQLTWISNVRLWLARLIVVAGAVAVLAGRFRTTRRTLVFGTTSLVISGFFILAYFLLGTLYVEIRHAAVLFAPFMLFILAVLFQLAPKGRARSWYVGSVSVVLIIFYSYGFTAMYPDFTKRGDWARVAAFVESNEKPGEPVVVFRNYEALAFAQNYKGPNLVLPEEKFFDWNYEGEPGTPAMWPKQIEYVISVIPGDAERVWLITEETCHTTMACRPLEKFVKENYTVVRQKDFYKERVRLLKKR